MGRHSLNKSRMSRSPGFSAFIISGRGFSVHPCTTHTAFGLAFFIASIIALPALPKSSLAGKLFGFMKRIDGVVVTCSIQLFGFFVKRLAIWVNLGSSGSKIPGRSNPFHLLRVLWADSEEVLLNVFSSFPPSIRFPKSSLEGSYPSNRAVRVHSPFFHSFQYFFLQVFLLFIPTIGVRASPAFQIVHFPPGKECWSGNKIIDLLFGKSKRSNRLRHTHSCPTAASGRLMPCSAINPVPLPNVSNPKMPWSRSRCSN